MKLKISRPTKKQLIALTAGGVLLLVLLIIFFMVGDSSAPSHKQEFKQQSDSVEPKTRVKILATGDWIAHDAINASVEESNYNYSSMTTPFKPFFDKSDINFCNVATLAGGEQFGITGYPEFNAPTTWLDGMQGLGCNLYNTGTNHTNDKGQPPISAELDHIDGLEGLFAHAGANRSPEEQQKVRYFEQDGVKFAFLSYSTYSNSPNAETYSLNRFDDNLVRTQMAEARSSADIVIVSMRWGTEYSSAINAAQAANAQKLASLGADIVLGHGQHVLGPVKKLSGLDGRETTVWYGMGNFLNAQLELEARTGCVAQFDVDIATKKLISTSCLPFFQYYDWTAEDAAAERLMSRKDFLIMPLFEASNYLTKSHLNTTVEEQISRISTLVNSYTEVPVQSSADL